MPSLLFRARLRWFDFWAARAQAFEYAAQRCVWRWRKCRDCGRSTFYGAPCINQTRGGNHDATQRAQVTP